MNHPEEEEEEQEWSPEEVPIPVKPTWVTRFLDLWRRHWNPERIDPPKVDPELGSLTGIERSAEVMRHSMLSLEYWLSPKGRLREWMRFNAKLAAILAIPSLLVVPLITFALGQFNTWTTLLAQTVTNLLFFPLSALLLVALISALVYFGRSLRRRPQHPQDYYYR